MRLLDRDQFFTAHRAYRAIVVEAQTDIPGGDASSLPQDGRAARSRRTRCSKKSS
jgi:hypothetical protein